jgi:hypothetical protein
MLIVPPPVVGKVACPAGPHWQFPLASVVEP